MPDGRTSPPTPSPATTGRHPGRPGSAGPWSTSPPSGPGRRLGPRGTTRAQLAVEAIRDGTGWRDASGKIQVILTGTKADLKAGRAVEVAGTLGAIAGPLNPGEFDYRAYLRAQGVRLRLSVDDPRGIAFDPGSGRTPSMLGALGRWWVRRLGQVRAWSHDRLIGGLGPAAAPLAAALLLGRREGVDPEVNDAFARTATTHLLAISGLHLQALAGALWLAFRVAGVRRRPAFAIVGLAAVGYALLVGLTPSVVRSAAMTSTVCLAGMSDRCARPANLLAVAALATLALNPSNLFDVGCQLSFLAVAAIARVVGPAGDRLRFAFHGLTFRAQAPGGPLDVLERRLEPWWRAATRRRQGVIVQGLLVSTVVWTLALPLVALRFHVVAPIGIALNIPLIPLTSLALLAAGLTLAGSAIWAPLAVGPAWACARLLGLIERIVRWGGSRDWGHAFVPGPPRAWVIGVYAGLALVALAASRRWPGRRAFAGLLGGWVAVGVVLTLRPDHPGATEADVLAVGHGLAVVVQGADGRAMLYDCGRMGDPNVGRRVIAPALWARGVRHLDRIVLSHADADHTNGLPDLLDRFSVGALAVAPGFGDRDPASARLLDLARTRGIPIETIAAGDRWPIGPGAEAEVVHPPAGWRPEAPDNDRSVVLGLDDAGRRLLLTGDLDAIGLGALIAAPARPADAVLAPHHGGRSANPPAFYDWARPDLILVSQQRPASDARDPLAFLAGRPAAVLRTWRQGAIQIRWTADGLSARGFLDRDEPETGSAGPRRLPGWVRPAIAIGVPGLGLGLALVLAVVEWGSWSLIRPSRRVRPPEPEPPPWQPIAAEAGDGTRLVGARRPAEGGSTGRTAILLHGFAEDRGRMRDRAEALACRGWDVALLDARGHGASGGDRVSFGGREADDLRAWIDLLAPDSGPVVVWGRSMGAAVAIRAAAADPRIGALVLEGPYLALVSAVAAWLRRLWLPTALAGALVRRAEARAGVAMARPRPIELAPEVAIPTLILHGVDDPVVPRAEARRLASAFRLPAALIEVEGARHTDVVAVGGDELLGRVAGWLDEAASRWDREI